MMLNTAPAPKSDPRICGAKAECLLAALALQLSLPPKRSPDTGQAVRGNGGALCAAVTALWVHFRFWAHIEGENHECIAGLRLLFP
jgi:hypothetical protein